MKKNICEITFDLGLPLKATAVSMKEQGCRVCLHDSILVGLVSEGELSLGKIGCNHIYKTGDFFLVDSMQLYILSCQKNCKALLLFLDVNYFKRYFPSIKDTIFTDNFGKQMNNCELFDNFHTSFLEIILSLVNKNPIEYNKIEGTIKEFIKMVLHHCQTYSYKLAIESKDNFYEFSNRMQTIYSYIKTHIGEGVFLEDLSKNEHLSPHYLSHFIKKYNGSSFRDISVLLRLRYSEQLLIDDKNRISMIAKESGFSTTKYFIKCFSNQFGMQPKEYRKKINDITCIDHEHLIMIDAFTEVKKYIKTVNASLHIKGQPLINVVKVDINKTIGTFHNLLSFDGDMNNLDVRFLHDQQKAIISVIKDFRMESINVYITDYLKGKPDPSKYMMISENINFIIQVGASVKCIFNNIDNRTLSNFLSFLKLFSIKFKESLTRIIFIIEGDQSNIQAINFAKRLKGLIKDTTKQSAKVIVSKTKDCCYCNFQNWIYDSSFIVPFAIDELVNPKEWTKAMPFSLVDPISEDGKVLCGGCGLFNWKGIKKPWWYAYEAIAKMTEEALISQGTGYIVTKRGDQIKILCYNTSNFNPNNIEKIKTKEELLEITKTAGIGKEYTFLIEGMKNGDCTVLIHNMNDDMCFFGKWAKLGFPEHLTNEEENVLNMTSHPSVIMEKHTINGEINLTVNIASFGATYILIDGIVI